MTIRPSKLSLWLIIAVLLTALPGASRAAGFTQSGPLYASQEASFDLFGSYLAQEHGIKNLFKTDIHGGAWGGGIGLNYFASANIGFGTDINIPDNGGQFIDSYTVNLIWRYPIESIGIAPYIIGGGGRIYDPSRQWMGQVGAGLEYRSSHKMGLFVDGRYEFAEHSGDDKLELRAGLRFVF